MLLILWHAMVVVVHEVVYVVVVILVTHRGEHSTILPGLVHLHQVTLTGLFLAPMNRQLRRASILATLEP